MKRAFAYLVLVACAKPAPTSQARTTESASASAPSVLASAAPVAAAFPPIDDSCKTDTDCTSTGLFDTCCGHCERRYANNDYVKRANEHCAKHPANECPPLACSWTTSTPKCIDGKCQAWTAREPIRKSTSCTAGELTYLGFRGTGMPPRALYDAAKQRFPDLMVYEVKDGELGAFTAEPRSTDLQDRQKAAAATVAGWLGDITVLASVKKDCTATFHMPPPP